MLWLSRIGTVGFKIPLSIAVIGTPGRELLWLAIANYSLGAFKLNSNSGILLPRLATAADRAIGPARDTVLHRPVEDGIAL